MIQEKVDCHQQDIQKGCGRTFLDARKAAGSTAYVALAKRSRQVGIVPWFGYRLVKIICLGLFASTAASVPRGRPYPSKQNTSLFRSQWLLQCLVLKASSADPV